MSTRAFSRNDIALSEATTAASFEDVLANVAGLDCTIIVPSAAHRRAGLVAWTRQMRGGMPPEIVTLTAYAQQLLRDQSANTIRLLNAADASLVLRHAARTTGQRPGSLDFSIERLLRWKAEGITPNNLLERAEDEFAPRFMRVLSRFARVWEAYEFIKGKKGADRVDMMALATRLAEATPSAKRFVVWSAHTFTHVEAQFIRAIGIDASVAIVWAPSSDVAKVRERTQDIIGWGWDQDGEEVAKQANIRVFRENTRIDEVRRILLTIKTAVSSGAVDVRDVCIISAGSTEYRRQLQERAARAGIPVAIDAERRLHTTGVALALRAACDVVAGGWKRSDVERLLRSGFVVAESVSVSALLRAGAVHRVHGGNGVDEWIEKLQHRRNVLRRVLEQENDSQQNGREVLALDAALNTLAWLRPALDIANASISGAQYAHMLTDFLQRLGIARTATHLESTADTENLPCAEREALVAIEALSERYAALTQEMRLPEISVGDHTREWWELVRTTNVRTPDVRLDGIPIYTPEEARGRTWKLVLAPGFVEGEFPLRDDDPLEAELLPEAVMRKQRAAFDDILHAMHTDGVVVATYPKEVDDAEVMPSAFLRGIAPESASNVAYLLDTCERDAHFGKGLHDVKGRQRAALPASTELATLPASTDLVDTSNVAAQFVTRIVNEPLSASRLDKVAACPYQYYASTILRVGTGTAPEDTLSGIERGAMMHEIAQRFYESVRGRRISDVTSVAELLDARVSLEDGRRSEYLTMLTDIFNDVARVYDTNHTYAETERRSMLGTTEREGLLSRWLAHEFAYQTENALRPALFEFDLDITIDGEAVRGRVDRIDVAPYQTHTGNTGVEFAVIDYKSTKRSVPKTKAVQAGDVTQMPLYMVAVLAAFTERGIEATPAHATYRTFGRSIRTKDEPADHTVMKNPTTDQLDNFLHAIGKHVSDMRASSYPVAPAPGACKHCQYQDVCRVASWGTV